MKVIVKSLSVAMCFFMLFGMTGCKFSPVIQEMVLDRFVEEKNMFSTPEYDNQLENEEETDELTEKMDSDTSQRQDPLSTAKPTEVQYRNDTKLPSAKKPVGTTGTQGGNSTPQNPDQTSQEGGGENGSGDNGGQLVPSGGGVREVIDSRGELVTVPENVGSVVAIGRTAELLLAAGGSTVVKGTSADFLQNQFIPANYKSSVEQYWDGDGSSVMDDAKFQKLLTDKPDVCVDIEGDTGFNDAQITQMKAAGIAYVTLPRLNSAENLKSAVKIAGQLIGDKSAQGGKNSNALADDYAGFVDAIVSDTQTRVKASGCTDITKRADGYFKGKFSLYVSGWDDTAQYSISKSGDVSASGTGAAYTGNSCNKATVAMSSFMAISGLENTMMLEENVASRNAYVSPIVVTGQKLDMRGSAAREVCNTRPLEKSGYGLGDSAFPAIIVETNSTAAHIRADQLWQVYEYITSRDGVFNAFGFHANDGSIIGTSVTGPYDIFVNPHGLASWSEGSAESILESVWLGWKFYGIYTDTEVMDKVRLFYSAFYGIDLTDDQIMTVLQGR